MGTDPDRVFKHGHATTKLAGLAELWNDIHNEEEAMLKHSVKLHALKTFILH